MGRLTTHVLDTARGRPAAGLAIVLLDGDGRELGRTVTNEDGRTDAPLLAGADFAAGVYELRFHVGPYFAADAAGGEDASSDPTAPGADPEPFLDVVPVRFLVADAEAHYHVPLLVAPYGYSTYRGS